MDVNGKNQRDVLTGQVRVGQGSVEQVMTCRGHRAVAHDAQGSSEQRYCNRCGKDDDGNMLGRPNGGWA